MLTQDLHAQTGVKCVQVATNVTTATKLIPDTGGKADTPSVKGVIFTNLSDTNIQLGDISVGATTCGMLLLPWGVNEPNCRTPYIPICNEFQLWGKAEASTGKKVAVMLFY